MKIACGEYHVFDRPRIPLFREWLNHFSTRPMLISRFFDRKAWKKVREIIREKKIDVLLVETLLMAKYAQKTPGTLQVLDEHNLEYVRAASRLEKTKGAWARIYNYLIMARLRRFEIRTIRQFDRCLVCSPEDRDFLSARVKSDALVVIPNAVDTDRYFPRRASPPGRKIAFLGTLWYEPNQDAVIYFVGEILPLLRPRVSGVEFIVIGPGPSRDVAALAQQEGVTITGYVDDVRPHLADVAVVVAPLRMGSGTRLKILTAMAMGIPVVSTAIGTQGIEGINGREICVADDPRDFCDCLERLLSDRQYNELVGRGGRDLVVRRYSRSVVLPKLREFWGHLGKGNCA